MKKTIFTLMFDIISMAVQGQKFQRGRTSVNAGLGL